MPRNKNIVFLSDRLADKTSDAGLFVPNGRLDRHWVKVNLDPETIGVRDIRKATYLHFPKSAIEYFQLRSIEFGNWMSEYDRQANLYGAMQSLVDLAKIFSVEDEQVGMNGFLSIALGARGKGGLAKAHYEPNPYAIINMTKTKGKDSFAHEYGHALDNLVAYFSGNNQWVSGGYTTRKNTDEKLAAKRDFIGLFERFFNALYFDPDGAKTDFCIALNSADTEYYESRIEVWARTFETWVSYQFEKKKIFNEYCAKSLKKISYYRKKKPFLYPSEILIERVDPLIREILQKAFALFAKESAKYDPKQKKSQKKNYSEEKISPKKNISREIKIFTQDGEIPARYEIVELETLIPSHNPFTFAPNKNYPLRCQQRDYTQDITEQHKVEQGAKHFKPEFVITESPTATDGAPIVTGEGIVLGGNGRSMMLFYLQKKEKYSLYKDYLRDNAERFGFSAGEIENFAFPVLVRVVNVDLERCAYYSNVLNKSLTQAIDSTTEAVSLARQLTPEILEDIAELFESADVETTAQFFDNSRAARGLVGILRRAKIITDKNANTFLDKQGEITSQGRDKIEEILLASVLEESATIKSAKNYSLLILKNLPLFIRIKKLGGWNIVPKIRKAIELEAERRTSGEKKNIFVKQSTFDRPDGITDSQLLAIWDALDAGPVKFSHFIKKYTQVAENESQDTENAFGIQLTPEELLHKIQSTAGLSDEIPDDEPKELPPKILSLTPRFEKFLGPEVSQPYSVFSWGQKFNGKSTFTLQWCEEMAVFGKVLFNSVEEAPDSATFKSRVEKTGVSMNNIEVVSIRDFEEYKRKILELRPVFIATDSIATLAYYTPEKELLKFFLDNRKKYSFLFVGRSDKEGEFAAGKSAWAFECDIEIVVENGIATTLKNRFYPDPRQVRKKKFKVF